MLCAGSRPRRTQTRAPSWLSPRPRSPPPCSRRCSSTSGPSGPPRLAAGERQCSACVLGGWLVRGSVVRVSGPAPRETAAEMPWRHLVGGAISRQEGGSDQEAGDTCACCDMLHCCSPSHRPNLVMMCTACAVVHPCTGTACTAVLTFTLAQAQPRHTVRVRVPAEGEGGAGLQFILPYRLHHHLLGHGSRHSRRLIFSVCSPSISRAHPVPAMHLGAGRRHRGQCHHHTRGGRAGRDHQGRLRGVPEEAGLHLGHHRALQEALL